MEDTTSSIPPISLTISEGSDQGLSSSFSVGGIYRRKHALRAVFRSASMVMLLGGWALYHHWYRDSNLTTDVALQQGNKLRRIDGSDLVEMIVEAGTGTDYVDVFTLRKL